MRITRGSTALRRGQTPTPTWSLRSESVVVTIADFGAHLCSVALPDDGGSINVTVDYPAEGSQPSGYHGASVGRYANRIEGARFDLDGSTYYLVANEGSNQLHGGPAGFDKHNWVSDAEVIGDTARVELVHRSPDGDQGFPGTVSVAAVFELVGDVLSVEYVAHSDAPTPINLTNHVYWNLGGPGSLDGHDLMVQGGHYLRVDDAAIPLSGPPASVSGTRFDCRTSRPLEEVLQDGGYDHCFLLDRNTEQAESAATLRHRSGRQIDVTTNQVGLQVYTGTHLPADARGIALETQCLPNTPNRPDFGDATLRPKQTYRSYTSFGFKW